MNYNLRLVSCDAGGVPRNTYYPSGVIDDYNGFALSLNRFGGYRGASITIDEPKNTPYRFDQGDQIKAYLDDELVYTGVVSQQSKDLARRTQEYTLRSKWDQLGQVSFTSETFGSYGTNAASGVAQILQYVHTTYVAPLGINWNPAKVSATATVERLGLKSTTDIYEFLQTLQVLAGADGNVYACGVDAAGDFYFLPTPNTLAATIDVNDNCLNVVEYAESQRADNIVVAGGTMPQNGYRLCRKYATTPTTKLRPVTVPGITREADAAAFAAGYFARYATGVSLQDVQFELAAPNIPKPWAGKIRYIDTERGIDVTDYFQSIDIEFGASIKYKVNIGLSTVSAEDQVFAPDLITANDCYAPAALDYGAAQREYVLALPEANENGLVYPADASEPHLAGPDIPLDGAGLDAINTEIDTLQADVTTLQGDVTLLQDDVTGLQGDVTTLQGDVGQLQGDVSTLQESAAYPAFTILDLAVNGGLKVGVNQSVFHALISNGNDTTALNTPNQVNFNYTFVNESGTVLQSGSIDAERISQIAAGLEIWTNHVTMEFTSEGILYCALSVGIPNTDPQEYAWYPADISGTNDYTKGLAARVRALTATGTSVTCIGFTT